MEYELLPTGAIFYAYHWSGFKEGEICNQPIMPYELGHVDGRLPCIRCGKLKETHATMRFHDIERFICPNTWIVTSKQNGRKFNVTEFEFSELFRLTKQSAKELGDEYANRSHELKESGVYLIDDYRSSSGSNRKTPRRFTAHDGETAPGRTKTDKY